MSDSTNEATDKTLGPHFGDIGAVWVEYGSEEHKSMTRTALSGMMMKKNGAANTDESMEIDNSKQPKIDLSYRPERYWTNPDPTFPLLAAITDADKQERAKTLAQSFDREAMIKLNEQGELTEEEADFYKACGLYVFDEEYGEPAFLEEPADIARTGFDLGDGFASSNFSVSVQVKRCIGQSAYRMQINTDVMSLQPQEEDKEEQDKWILLDANQTLTLEDVAGTLEEGLPQGSVEICLAEQWGNTEDQTEDALDLLDIQTNSDFYPDLSAYFDNKVEKWRQSVRDAGGV